MYIRIKKGGSIMWRILVVSLALFLVLGISSLARAEDKVVFGFEKDNQGWEIPEWAVEQTDYVAKSVDVSKDFAKEGKSSLKVMVVFPGKTWTGALVEDFEYFDWTPYKAISADIYIPKEAPQGLKAKIILTVGENWKFVEMARSIPLIPGEWTTISANLMPGSEDWKKMVVDEAFRKDVRKVAIRVEANKKPEYSGPIYIDNIKLSATK